MPEPGLERSPEEEREAKPQAAEHLRLLKGEADWIKALLPIGIVLLLLVVALTFFAPSALWFLLYPVLILGALAALTAAAAWLMRHF